MSKKKVVLNKWAVRNILRSKEMESICKSEADKIANGLGVGYKTDVFKGRNRVNSGVYADSKEANEDNFKNNTMLKAVR